MCLIPTIIFAGFLGGIAFCLLNSHPAYPEKSPGEWSGDPQWTRANFLNWLWKLLIAIVLGNAAAFTVPVLLHATSSNLVREIINAKQQSTSSPAVQQPELTQAGANPTVPPQVPPLHRPNQPVTPGPAVVPVQQASTPPASIPSASNGVTQTADPSAWYLFFGFCVLAAYAAPRFLQAMLSHVLKQLGDRIDQVEDKTREQSNRVAQVEETARFAQQSAEEIADDISEPAPSSDVQMLGAPNPILTTDEQKVLLAFQKARREHQWVRRSLEGLVTDTSLPEDQVMEALVRLSSLGLVQKRPGRGRAGWLLSATGVMWNPIVRSNVE